MMNYLDLPTACSAEEAVQLVNSLADQLCLPGEPLTLRTLRLWRSKHLLTAGNRQVTRKNLLEVVSIRRLRAEGVTTHAAADQCRALDEERLWLFLTASEETLRPTPGDFALVTLQLLAHGILQQYQLIARGAIVGHTAVHRPAGEETPAALRQASARLGRLYFEEGREDLAASLHMLLVRAMRPLRDWAPRAIWTLPSAADMVLIDPAYRVPSEDCELIAQQAEGAAVDDLIEHHIHHELMQALAKLGDEANAAYTAIREFIGRHPLATRRELHGLYARPELPRAAISFVQHLYIPVHADLGPMGRVFRCKHCGAPIGRKQRCLLQGCQEDHPVTESSEIVPLEDAFVARPEVLKYWADPAREELRLYDGLRSVGFAAELYPHSDRCDVAIGEEIGVDVKDYRDPATLARKLNRGIGGLAFYPRRILAVADRRARSGDYLARLHEQLLPSIIQSLEVYSVKETLHTLKREGRAARTKRADQDNMETGDNHNDQRPDERVTH